MFIFIVVEFDDDFLRRFRIDSAFNQFKINYLASHKYLKLIGIGLQLINWYFIFAFSFQVSVSISTHSLEKDSKLNGVG